ncbi:uncharacterized protein LOC119687945 [Teleopsis dalmanni]|uniref:uncharacterized protein LOC119687945 n=1 Tax=Teleopsis dalmanni TaxID=139649 RepID=UPI0018CD85AA|nr:uncharacterized protein LOC119687945 [Teleopsis dalmanni]
MQDITSEVPPPHPVCSDEVIISCRQSQQQSTHQHQQQQQQQQQSKLQLQLSKETQSQQLQQQPQPQQQLQQEQQEQSQSLLSTTHYKQQNQKVITRSQSSKVIQELQHQHSAHQLKQQQSLPTTLHPPAGNANNAHHPHTSKSVSILVYKTLNTVFKSSRKIIVRVCEVASVKKSFTMFKFSKAAAQNRAQDRANACTGHDQFVKPPVSDKKAKHIMKKLYKQNGLKRSNSAIEFDVSALTAANRRQIYSRNRSASSEQDNSDHSEHSEKSPLVSARLDNLARLFFSKSMPAETGSRDTIESVLTTRPNLKYQYSALDSGNGVVERSPRERAHRERALNVVTQEWVQNSNGRYEVIAHLDEIGSRHAKNWFLVNDASVRTDRLMTLLPLPPDCVALEDLPPNESPKGMLMELLGSLHHPYIYPVLDLGFLRSGSMNYACLVTPFNSRGSLKDLIYKAQWNEPWVRKYTRKPNGLPVSQVQRLGRQILEALLFLKERGFPLHGHLHSGNVILQNGAARLSGLENGLLGLSSRINAVIWSRSTTEIENVDIICFGHLLYEMCTGQEMTTPKPSMRVLEMELEHYPQILDILGLIFEPPSGMCPSVEELVLCDLFRSIDLRELRGPCFSTIKPSLSRSTLNLLHAVKKRQCASLGNSLSETSSPCTPPSTPRDRRSGISRTMDSFDISSDSEEGLLDEIVVGSNYHQEHLQKLQYYQQHLQNTEEASTSAPSPYYYHQYMQYITLQPHSQQLELHHKQQQYYDAIQSPIHHCNTATHSDDNSCSTQEHQQHNYQYPHSSQHPPSQLQSYPQHHSSQQHPQSQPHQHQYQQQLQQQQQANIFLRCSSSTSSNLSLSLGAAAGTNVEDTMHLAGSSTSISSITALAAIGVATTINKSYNESDGSVTRLPAGQLEFEISDSTINNDASPSNVTETFSAAATAAAIPLAGTKSGSICNLSASTSAAASANASFNHQLTADMCNYKNSKSRRLEYSLKCLKYGRSNPSQDSAFGSLTDNDLSIGSSSFRLSSFQSISSPIDEGVEDIIIATTSTGNETCLELATIPHNMVSQDSANSSPCRESSPSNFLNIDDGISGGSYSGGSSSSGSTSNIRPQQFPISLSPKILVTATTNSSNSSLASASAGHQQHQLQQFDPPKILVNDQNSIYTTSPSKRSGTIEVFSQKYRVSSFEDMSPNQRCSSANSDKHLRNVNRMAFRSLEEERRIDNAFMPIIDRTNSDNRVNMQSEKYKKLTHASFCISKTSSQVTVFDTSPCQNSNSIAGSTTLIAGSVGAYVAEIQRPATVAGTSSTRQMVWRDSKFYRKNRIAKSNDSLLEISPNHSARLSPSSLRDNQYDSCSSYGSRSHSRHSLYRGSSNEICGSNQTLGLGLAVTTSFCSNGRRYCSSKSEDLGESIDYLRVMDARKSYSERHLVTLTKLKQTAINSTSCNEKYYTSEDEVSFTEDNNSSRQPQQPQQHEQQIQQQQHLNQHQQQQQKQKRQFLQQNSQTQQNFIKRSHPNQLSWSTCSINRIKTTNIKTTSLATLSCHPNLTSAASTHITAVSLKTPTPKTTTPLADVAETLTSAALATGSVHGSTVTKVATAAVVAVSRSSAFKLLNHALNIIDSGGSGSGSGAGSATCTTTEENSSSTDESPLHQTLSSAELSRIFAMDDAQGSSCSEEKTPLLDSVEMSPISPTEPDMERGEQM